MAADQQPEMPQTRLPRRPGWVPVPQAAPVKRTPKPDGWPRPSISVDRTVLWIATSDNLQDIMAFWNAVKEKLSKLGARPNKGAMTSLPEGGGVGNYNGGSLRDWLKTAGPDDIDTLQKFYAASRLRARHANWLSKTRSR